MWDEITYPLEFFHLTHGGQVMHLCIGNLTIIGSDNVFLPGWRQAIVWTNAGIWLIGSLGTNFSEILIKIQTPWFKKKRLKVSSAKGQPFCHGLNVWIHLQLERGTRPSISAVLIYISFAVDQCHTEILHFDGLVQDCSNSSALAIELLQSCTKPSICR